MDSTSEKGKRRPANLIAVGCEDELGGWEKGRTEVVPPEGPKGRKKEQSQTEKS